MELLALAPSFLAEGWLPEDWTMHTSYLACAAIGGTVLVLQIVLSLFGIGDHDGDMDAGGDVAMDHDHGGGLPVLSIRAITSALLIFGLVGMIGTTDGWGTGPTVAVSALSGVTVLVLVAWLIKLQTKLTQSGSEDPLVAVGTVGRVYLRIPGANQGRGKVTVEIRGRSMEYDAFTEGKDIPTGARVRVVRLAAPAFFEVAELTEESR